MPDTPRHPGFFSLPSLLLIAPLCVAGAIIGTELIITLGITTNTALIGALAGIGLARLPRAMFAAYQSPHMQNLAQTAVSASTFGAGNAALIQVAMLIRKGGPVSDSGTSAPQLRRALGLGTGGYLAIAVLLALLGGVYSAMPAGMLLVFIVYAAFAAFVHVLIVGLAAMHTGWFPAFAVALITLVIGMLIGFPPAALCLLVGFSAATGPAFATMGYAFKAGHMLRGDGADAGFERDGRTQ